MKHKMAIFNYMNKLLYSFILFCPLLAFGQKNTTIVVDPQINHPLFASSDSIYNPATLVFTDSDGKIHYDGVPDSNKYAVMSNVIINNDPDRQMRFVEAMFIGDSLYITIDESNASEYHTIQIAYSSKGSRASFKYGTPMMGHAEMVLDFARITLDKSTYKKGDWVKGKIHFRAICKTNCNGVVMEGIGYFKAKISTQAK